MASTVVDQALSTSSKIPLTRTEICAEARAAVHEVLASGWVTMGEQVATFETEFAQKVRAERAVAVSSCTAALELSLRAMHLDPGAKVVMSTTTFCGAAAAIIHAGLTPVLADVDPLTAMPSAATIAQAVAEVGGVSAMIVIHLGGLPADVAEVAAAAGIGLDRVVEDAAHALGTWVGDRPVGSTSRATCFSFYATKNLAIGEGGMVTTDDEDLADTISRIRLHGLSADAWRRYRPGAGWRYDVAEEGLKANMTDVQAAIGRAQLRRFDDGQAHRARAAGRYDERLSQIPGITLPVRPRRGRHAWHLYAVRVTPAYGLHRDDVVTALGERGIGSSVHFIPIHRLTWFSEHCAGPRSRFPGADAVFEETLSLPLDDHISDQDVDRVCSTLATLGGPR